MVRRVKILTIALGLLLSLSLTAHLTNWKAQAERLLFAFKTPTAPTGPVSPLRGVLAEKLKTQAKVKVELFVMSQCPFGVQAEEAVAPLLKEYGDRIEFSLNFIASPTAQPNNFKSLHGQPEVEEDIRQVVMARQAPQRYLDYVVARASNYRSQEWKGMARAAGIDAEAVEHIAQSETGRRLLAENIRRANALHISASPTIFVDGQKYSGRILPPREVTANAAKPGAVATPTPPPVVPCTMDSDCANNKCLTGKCISGLCVIIDCDDKNPCTDDSCDPVALGCQHTPANCDDNNACTTDTCDIVKGCVHTPIDCNDNNACTIDSCDPKLGCVHTPVNCDDNNPCTTDTCDPVKGCVNTPKNLNTFTVTGGGAYCAGGPGVNVGLSGSQPGVSYQLLLNGNPVGSPVPGSATGDPLDFGPQTAGGTYTVVASNGGSCPTTMNGSAVVTVENCSVKVQDPAVCFGPNGLVTVTASITNNGPSTVTNFTATLPAQLAALNGTCMATGGTCNVVNPSSVTASVTLATGQTTTITYQALIVDGTPAGTQLCINSSFTFGNPPGPATPIQACLTVNCPTVGPGTPPPAAAPVSDQKPGSVLFYNLYTSNPTNLAAQNTRLNLTNTDPARSVAVHLFFVDGATCTPADSFVCLTPNQTMSFTAGDADPGTTGYIIAVVSDPVTGCPINFNFLIGDGFVKLASGHQANLGAESFAALTGGLPLCAPGSLTATLNFDGVSYNQVPRVVAVNSFPSPADGNSTLVILNRVGGDLRNGASTIGSLFGVLFDESEQPFSFTLSSNTCQFRFTLNNASLRIVQRLETVIGPGRTGWLRLWGANDIGLLGSIINFNGSAGVNGFSQGHNLHKLTFTSAASLTIPIIPPAC